MKKIIVTGATGSIGKRICRLLIEKGDEVIIFTRNLREAKNNIPKAANFIEWNYNEPEVWKNELNGKDAIVHLAGANLGAKRWNEKYKKLCYDSRVISTRNLVDAIKSVDQKPKVFICSSAVGYYGNRNDEVLDESSLSADNYLGKLCRDWEAEAAKVEEIGIRRVSVRTGLVLNKNEGLIKQMLPTFKMFLGGYLANGKQWFPWIHIDDIVGIYLHAIENERLRGAINGASPGIVRNKEFSKTLGKVMNRPSLFPIPKFALKLVTGELGEYAVMGQRTSVEKIIKSGYKFMFENLEEALKNIIKSE
ncbi:MAG: TIGR01777 family oxidoreductase [Ignavibacteriaceae bacterium]